MFSVFSYMRSYWVVRIPHIYLLKYWVQGTWPILLNWYHYILEISPLAETVSFFNYSMDHIFGDSHDIAFGAKSPSKAPSSNDTPKEALTPRGNFQHDDFGDLEPSSWAHKIDRPVRTQNPIAQPSWPSKNPSKTNTHHTTSSQQRSLPISDGSSTPVLTRLTEGMKSSFLPREEDTTIVRIVVLSDPSVVDPLMLITRDDTTILLGSWFGTMSHAGSEYLTFPDMRLVISEKTRLNAWILNDSNIDVRAFETILPAIWFPPIYATREIIAKFRNNITQNDFLSKCRFFELFADGITERRIGNIDWRSDSILTLKSGSTEIGFSHFSPSPLQAPANIVTRTLEKYSIGNEIVNVWEILSFRWNEIKRHSMKFTFDTFFIDKNSVWVVAWYTLGDREQLASNGVLIFTLEEDTRARTIAGHIFIDSRGFVHAHEMMSVHKEILKWIRSTYEKLILENPKIDRGSLVQWLRRELTKYCYLLTGRTPVVMPILIER